jgi:hypothetical protein
MSFYDYTFGLCIPPQIGIKMESRIWISIRALPIHITLFNPLEISVADTDLGSGIGFFRIPDPKPIFLRG